MADPSPSTAQQTTDLEGTPLANGTPNGTPVPADIEMADSIPAQEVCFPFLSFFLLKR